MKRPLLPAPRAMNADERADERRFVKRLLLLTIGLHLVSGAVALTAVCRVRPRMGGAVPVPVQNVQVRVDATAPKR
jgi:hypothetical protein